jgi:hypothetical protein
MQSEIPIIIICYNNYRYVQNTLLQILSTNKEYYKNIQILNNNSTCLETLDFLKKVDVKVIHNENNGPWISSTINTHIYDVLPNKFILTDPDLKLNEHIPKNFIEILSFLSDEYQTSKIGFALDISDFDKMYKYENYCSSKNIFNWESQFWIHKIDDDRYELYKSDIDTTFCLVNKNYQHNCFNMRIARNFTAKHLPWYIDNEIFNTYENYLNALNTTNISTISKIIKPYIDENYLKIYKNNELFLIKNENENLFFWKNTFSQWENETFEILDTFLSKDKVFIDIGNCIGTTMYGCRKSKHVYSTDKSSEEIHNLKTNCSNYTIESIEDIENIKKYQNNISLIKVDIKGEEENILNVLFDLHTTNNVPLYIKFYYDLWKDKNIDRFHFLSENNKKSIVSNSFISILFKLIQN